MKTFFWILITITLATLAASLFYFYQYFTTKDVALSVEAPREIAGGLPFELKVFVKNESEKPIDDVEINMILPEHVFFANEGAEKRFFKKSVDTMNAGEEIQETIALVIVGEEQSIKQLSVEMSYTPPALSGTTRFNKTKTAEIAVRESSIGLDMIVPEKVLNDEEFEIELHYQNNTDRAFENVEISLNLPPFFSVRSADPKTTKAPATWNIGLLAPNTNGVIKVKGKVLSAEQSFFTVTSLVKSGSFSVNQKSADISISSSPLLLGITVNGSASNNAKPGDPLQYILTYRNNSDIGLNDVVIKAKLTGIMYNFGSMVTSGTFDSKNNTITWNAASNPELLLIAPGGNGTIQFQLAAVPTYPIRRLADRNFTLKVNGEISSPTVPYYVVADRTVGIASIETRVQGNLNFDARIYHYDPITGLGSKGPIPPKANNATHYSLRWVLTNYATDKKDIEVRGRVEPGVKVVGIKTNLASTSTLPVYNDRTGEVVWNIPQITANKGAIGTPVEAMIQLEATPNITQIGRAMPLFSDSTVRATDEFTGTAISASDVAITTQINDDTRVTPQGWNVVQ